MFENAEVISRYTRVQAIKDGVLKDVSATAREAGILYPVAVTAAVWAECIGVPEGVTCQDEQGRLWDVVWMLRCVIQGCQGYELRFSVLVKNRRRERIHLRAVCGPGDNGEPVITVMMPNED